MHKLKIKKLTEANFADYESLTGCQKDGGCYCAFWHQKWSTMDGWAQRQKEAPELKRQTVLDRVKSGFHVGILAYQDDKLVAWVSVGPLPISTGPGDESKAVAGITRIAMAPEFRGKGLQSVLLTELLAYGKAQRWTAIEGYPFDQSEL